MNSLILFMEEVLSMAQELMPNLTQPADDANVAERIKRVAHSLFLEKGINNTEMMEIAKAADVSRSTLYRYFPDKNRLAFRVCLDVEKTLLDEALSDHPTAEGTGYEKFWLHLQTLICVYRDHIQEMLFISDFDRIYSGEYPDIPEAAEYVETMQRIMQREARFLYGGMADGSIRQMRDPNLFLSVLINTLVGVSTRVFARDAHYREEHNAESMQIVQEALRILLESVKG